MSAADRRARDILAKLTGLSGKPSYHSHLAEAAQACGEDPALCSALISVYMSERGFTEAYLEAEAVIEEMWTSFEGAKR